MPRRTRPPEEYGQIIHLIRRSEVATCALCLPRNLIGRDAVLHTRRPEA